MWPSQGDQFAYSSHGITHHFDRLRSHFDHHGRSRPPLTSLPRCSKTTASPQLQTVERPRRPSRVDTSGRGGGGYEASTRDVSRCCNRARSCARCRPWRLVLRWLPLEAVKASYWHRVNLGDTDELVGGLIGSEGVLWPRLVADSVVWPPHAPEGTQPSTTAAARRRLFSCFAT